MRACVHVCACVRACVLVCVILHVMCASLDQDRPWTDVAGRGGCGQAGAKYCSAVWELFQLETKYLCNQLQPLEQVRAGGREEWAEEEE